MKFVLTSIFLICLSLLAVLHFLAIEFYLYWQYAWFDLPMHVFGGAIVALGFRTFFEWRMSHMREQITLVHTLVFVGVVVIGWELFEFHFGLIMETGYVFDTIVDLFCGLVGGGIGHVVGRNIVSLSRV